jgi:hypothetical protein
MNNFLLQTRAMAPKWVRQIGYHRTFTTSARVRLFEGKTDSLDILFLNPTDYYEN